MPVRAFNASVPVELQLTEYSCAVGATFWFLRSLNVDVTQPALQDLMVPALVSPDLGLLDGSGSSIARFLRDQFGLVAANVPAVSFDDVASRAGRGPIAMGGHCWHGNADGSATGHWVGVRGFDGAQLLLANPGGTGPSFGQQTLARPDFLRRGAFSAVWLAGTAAPGRTFSVANTGGQGALLRADPNTVATILGSLAEGTVVSGADHAWRLLTGIDGDDGWMADEFLASADGQFQVANTSGQGANLRREPDPASAVIKVLPEGTPVNAADHAWRQVTTADGTRAWIANDLLVAHS
jgi:SH3-like domain-containing protein